MKKTIITMCLMLVLMGGCWESVQIKSFAEDVTQLSTAVDALQETTTDVIGTLAELGLVNEGLVAKVDKANEEIDRVQLQTTDAAIAIKDADYVTGDDVGNMIKAAKAGTAATAPWNPYSTIIILGLTVLEGITALFLKKKNDKLIKTNEGISKFEGTSEPAIASQLHDIVKAKTANL